MYLKEGRVEGREEGRVGRVELSMSACGLHVVSRMW
jgi:hypothetical protein